MASSNMRALWEARADQALANMDQKPNISTNQRKHSHVEPSAEPHRPRLGSNRRTISANRKLNGMRKQSKESVESVESLESLDDILLSLQNAIVADKEDDPDTNVVNDAKKGVNVLKEKIMEKNSPQISKAEEYPRQNVSGLEKTSLKISNKDQVFRQNSKDSEGQVSNKDLVHGQFSNNKNSSQTLSNGQVFRQNSKETQKSPEITKTETLVGQEETTKTTKTVKQTLDSKETIEANFTNYGENVVVSALKSLQSTESFEKNEKNEVNERVEMENVKKFSPTDAITDILMRIVDENTTDICQVKRQSARLSLHNTLEIVPENEPIETKHTEPKENNAKDEITEIIEKLEKCNDLESLKCACINSFIALDKTLVEMKASLAENRGNTKQMLNSPPAILAPPPPPPPPGPPPLALTPKKLLITKALKPTMASTATAAVGAVNLMDEIKRKQMIRKGRKSLKSRYETLDNN